MNVTQQFKFCGNPFRVDMYKGCNFGCLYCFANSKQWKNSTGWDEADITDIEKLFKKAFETDDNVKDANIELLRHKVPLHLGGNSDPFQGREWEKHLTYKMIELTNKYQYPMTISTKTAHLPEEYLEILDPKLHGIQVSIMGWEDDFIRKYEVNTPTAKERVEFVRLLHNRGIWTSIRIQPLINLDEALKVVNAIKGDVNYITVEHLKIPTDNKEIANLFAKNYLETDYYIPKHGGRNWEVIPPTKEANFKKIAEVANGYGVKVGCGDNDLHHLTQSRCCCGIDTIPGGAFNNFLKFNLTYLTTGDYDLSKIWKPKSDVSGAFNSKQQHRTPDLKTMEDWTRRYINRHNHLVYASGKTKILRDLFPGMAVQKTLFSKKTVPQDDEYEDIE